MRDNQDETVEWKVLASLFIQPQFVHRLTRLLFTDDRMLVFDSMVKALQTYGNLDPESVLAMHGSFPRQLTTQTPVNQDALLDVLTELAYKRQLIEKAEKLHALANRNGLDLKQVMQTLRLEHVLPESDETLGSAIGSVLSDVRLKRDGKYNWLTTGLRTLDNFIGEFPRKSVSIIAAAPGHGKTAFALQLLVHMAEQKHRTKIYSLEMSRDMLITRIAANMMNLDYGNILTGNLTEKEITLLEEGFALIQELPMEINDNAAISIAELLLDLQKFAANGGTFAVIDYVQIMPMDSDNRAFVLGEFASQLKTLAKKLGLRIVLLSQLNDEGLLYESRKLQHVCDLIFKLELDQYPDFSGFRAVKVTFTKNKFGRDGTLNLLFDAPHQRFVDGVREGDYGVSN